MSRDNFNDIKPLFSLLDNEYFEIDYQKLSEQTQELLNNFNKLYNINENKILIDRFCVQTYRTSFMQLLQDNDINTFPSLVDIQDDDGAVIWPDFIRIIYQIINSIDKNDISQETNTLISIINKNAMALNKPLRLRLDRNNTL